MSRQMTLNDGDYFQLPWGRITFHNNELFIESDVNDPAGLSMTGAMGCKLSWKRDGQEKVLIQLRENPLGHGEVYVGVLDQSVLNATGNLDRAMIEVLTINPYGAEFRVPVKFSAGVAQGQVSGTLDTLWAQNGLTFVQVQPDGNFVYYRAAVAFDKGTAYDGRAL